MKCFADTVSDYPVDLKLMFHAANRQGATHLIIAIDKNANRKKIVNKWHFYPHECYFITSEKDSISNDTGPSLNALKKILIAQGNTIIIEHEFPRYKRMLQQPVISTKNRIIEIAKLFNITPKAIYYGDQCEHNNGDVSMVAEFSELDFKKLDKAAFMSALEIEFYGAAIFPHGTDRPYISVRITEESHPWAW